KQKGELDKQELLSEYEENLIQNPEIFEATAPAINDELAGIEQQSLDSDEQFIDSVADLETSPEVKAAAVNKIKLWETLQESTRDIGAFDYTKDFLAGMVTLVDTFREGTTLGSVWNNEEVLRDMVFNFKALPFEEQQRLFPGFSKEILEGLGPIRGIDTLTKFIEPVEDEAFTDFSNFWKLFDVADVTTLGAAIAFKVARAKKVFNLPKILKGVGAKDAASDAVTAAVVDPEAAKAMNISQSTATSDSMPFDVSDIDEAFTGELSTGTIENIKTFFGKADRTVDDIIEGNGYLKEGVLNTIDRARREEEIYDQLSNAKHENVKIVARSENTSKFEYNTVDPEGNIGTETYTLELKLDDNGAWDQKQLGFGGGFLPSPTVWATGTTRLDVDVAQIIDSQTAKVFRNLAELQRQAVAPLGNLSTSPKARDKLDQVSKALKAGDEWIDETTKLRGKVFSPDDPELAGFTDDMLEAYYNTNRLFNNLWRVRNNVKREEMIAFGFKRVNLLDEEYGFGKPFDTANDARLSIQESEIDRIYDIATDDVVTDITTDALEAQYAMGKKLVRLQEPYQTGEKGGLVKHILVDVDAVEDLPSQVLNRRVGYVPRVYDNGTWFVKTMEKSIIDGKVSKEFVATKTHRFFDNEKDALTYRQSLIDDAVKPREQGGEGLTLDQAKDKYQALEDREQEIIATATGQFSNGSGGLYTGARSEDAILYGLEGTSGQRVNPYEALVRNIANVSRLSPINQWRLGMEQRWMNTAKALNVPVTKFGEIPKSIESTRKGKFLNKMANQIRVWQGFPTVEEQVYTNTMQRLYEWSLGYGRNSTSKLIGWARDKDPIAASRAAAFHTLLGWFNPAQLWVQAQGMSVAVSINLGKNLAKTLKHTTGLTILGTFEDVSKGRKTLAAKAAGMSVDELDELHTLWKKTGLEDSILQTADHAAAIRGHGIAMDAISRAADRGLLFYRHGDLLNRRMAFTTAVDEWKTANPGKVVTDLALKDKILPRTNNLMLNMSKANGAQWQRGILSLPTQFFQVSAKALETVGGFNDNLTAAERLRVFAGQIALYGTAGVPLINLGANYLTEVMGVTQEDIDNNPLLVKTWNDGFWGFTTLGVFGIDAEVSDRGSLIRGVTDFVDNWMFTESSVAEKLMGAFGSTGQRFWDSFTREMRPLAFNNIQPYQLARLATLPILESISTWRNGEKALMMQAVDRILTRRGGIAVERDFEIRESIAAAIGFRLTDEARIFNMQDMIDQQKAVETKTADAVVQMLNHYTFLDSIGMYDEKAMEEQDATYSLLLEGLDYDARQRVTDMVKSKVGRESKLDRALNTYLQKVYSNRTEGINNILGFFGVNSQITSTPLRTEEE
ncbi:MAG: hypothetical protein JSW41_00305, partial [Candidatus Aenigmatarchaeota archaeon]